MCEVDQKHTIEMDVDGVEIEKKENEKEIRLGWNGGEKTFRLESSSTLLHFLSN